MYKVLFISLAALLGGLNGYVSGILLGDWWPVTLPVSFLIGYFAVQIGFHLDGDINHQKWGVRKTFEEWTEDAACNMAQHIESKVPLSKSTLAWMKMHAAKDAARKQAEKNEKEQEENEEYQKYLKLKKKFGP